MLDEEEIKAIKALKSYINAIETFGTIDYKCINNLYEPTKTILNLITKLQEENEEKDKQIDLMAKWIFDKDYIKNSLLIHRDDCYSNCIKQVKKYFEKLAKETE